MNTDTKVLNKIIARKIQQYTKRKIIYHEQVRFIHGIQGWFNIQISLNAIQHSIKEKLIISVDEDKEFAKIQYLLMIKTLNKLTIEGNYLDITKIYMENSQPTLCSMMKDLKPKSGTKQGCLLLPLLLNIVLGILVRTLCKKKE